MGWIRWLGCALAGVMVASGLSACSTTRTLSHGRFDRIPMVEPHGDPEALVLLLSGLHGIGPRDQALARALANQGGLVAMLDTPALLQSLAADGDDCSYPDGDLENLGHYIEAAYSLPGYRPPILAGDDIGATLAMATLAQANDQTFAGAITTSFSPRINTPARLCNTGALKTQEDKTGFTVAPASQLAVPWFDQQTDIPARNVLAPFAAASDNATLLAPGIPRVNAMGDRPLALAFHQLRARQEAEATAALPASVEDLPLTLLKAAPGGAHPHTMAILLTGDGGWAGIDKDIGDAVAAAGIPVVGFDTLRYYWKSRSPEESAHDISRVMRYYSQQWHRPKVLLIGYSRGADVLPFIINRLPADQRQSIERAVMLALGSHITFEFEIKSWFGFSGDGIPVTPEAAALPAGLGLCIYGTDDDDSICQRLDPARMQQIPLAGGHHFDGGYEEIARLILNNLSPAVGIDRPSVATTKP
jgi:type IV secretory pathway VirJ component